MKNNQIIISSLLAVSFALGCWFIGKGFSRKPGNEYVSVTGMAEESFSSDLVQFTGNFSEKCSEIKEAYQAIKSQAAVVKKYFISKGVKADEISMSTLSIDKEFDWVSGENGYGRNVFSGYKASQAVYIKSIRIDAIEAITRESMELIEQGIEFSAGSPEYYFTKLSDLKLNLIEKASQDAKARATKISGAAGDQIGVLKKANLGVFQITGENACEDEYSWGGAFNTSSRNKKARITVSASYSTK